VHIAPHGQLSPICAATPILPPSTAKRRPVAHLVMFRPDCPRRLITRQAGKRSCFQQAVQAFDQGGGVEARFDSVVRITKSQIKAAILHPPQGQPQPDRLTRARSRLAAQQRLPRLPGSIVGPRSMTGAPPTFCRDTSRQANAGGPSASST